MRGVSLLGDLGNCEVLDIHLRHSHIGQSVGSEYTRNELVESSWTLHIAAYSSKQRADTSDCRQPENLKSGHMYMTKRRVALSDLRQCGDESMEAFGQ